MSGTLNADILGNDRIPQQSGLLVPGRLNLAQLQIIESQLAGRPILYLAEENHLLDGKLQAHLDKTATECAVFSLSDNPSSIGSVVKEKLGENGLAIFVTGLANSRPATNCLVPSPIIKFLCQLDVPITPVAVHIPAESCLAIEDPASLPSSIISFGKQIKDKHLSLPGFHQSLLEAAEEAFSSRDFLNGSLPIALLKGLKKHAKTNVLHDGTDDSELPFSKILGAAIALSKEITKSTKK
ncbi:MAG: 2-acyl-glycerophospho-ethanolamine acyltransferase, partial [Verrucomicrobiota bacterium]